MRIFAIACLTTLLVACSNGEPAQEDKENLGISESAKVALTADKFQKPKQSEAPTPAPKPEQLQGIAKELNLSHPPRNQIEKARNSTVFIDTGFGTGSGFFLDKRCIIATNKHVVQLEFSDMKALEVQRSETKSLLERGVLGREDRRNLLEQLKSMDKSLNAYLSSGKAKEIWVSLVNGYQLEAKILSISEQHDLAYLYIKEEGCPVLETNHEDDLPLGYKVFTIGNPAGMKYSVTSGIVSGYQEREEKRFVQTDAAINPGNSGGPLIDDSGKLLGVNTMILSETEGIGFAIPTNILLEDFESQREYIRKALNSSNIKFWQPKTGKQLEDDKKKNAAIMEDALQKCIAEFNSKEFGVAREECQVAADYLSPQGQYLMAELLINSENPKDYRAAIDYYMLSYQAGYGEAIYRVAEFYESGDHLEEKPQMARALYAEACEVHHAEACNAAAVYDMVRHKQDYETIVDLLTKAKEYGSVAAISNLASLYQKGKGLVQDKKKALALYREAAMIGNNPAQFMLAAYYYEGSEVKKDYSEAYVWSLVAEMDDNDFVDWEDSIPANARFFLDKLLSKSQKQKARKKANELTSEIVENTKKHEEKYRYRNQESEISQPQVGDNSRF